MLTTMCNFKNIGIQTLKHAWMLSYSAQERFPGALFSPLSTEASRTTRQRLARNRTIQRFHRTRSVYLRNERDVKLQFGLLPEVGAGWDWCPLTMPCIQATYLPCLPNIRTTVSSASLSETRYCPEEKLHHCVINTRQFVPRSSRMTRFFV